VSSLRDDIRSQYARRDATKGDRYAWYQPDVINQETAKERAIRRALHRAVGRDLSGLRVLDVGCGTGSLLRKFVELGVPAANCTGIDLLPDRVEEARRRSPEAITLQHGQLDVVAPDHEFDLVTAFTVLSSVLRSDDRRALIEAMWARVRPGGWLMVFDLRFNNPRNKDVRAVRTSDSAGLSPSPVRSFRLSLLTPPPIARRLCRVHWRLDPVCAALLPMLRSHRLTMLQRSGTT